MNWLPGHWTAPKRLLLFKSRIFHLHCSGSLRGAEMAVTTRHALREWAATGSPRHGEETRVARRTVTMDLAGVT